MSLPKTRPAALRTLRAKVPLEKLSHVQPVLLLQMIIGLSQVLNGAAAQPEQMARMLIRDGQQRLRALRAVAPDLDLSLARLLSGTASDGKASRHYSHEESAVQAMMEMCIGLLLRHLAGTYAGAHSAPAPAIPRRPLASNGLASHCRFSLILPPSARSCLMP